MQQGYFFKRIGLSPSLFFHIFSPLFHSFFIQFHSSSNNKKSVYSNFLAVEFVSLKSLKLHPSISRPSKLKDEIAGKGTIKANSVRYQMQLLLVIILAPYENILIFYRFLLFCHLILLQFRSNYYNSSSMLLMCKQTAHHHHKCVPDLLLSSLCHHSSCEQIVYQE